SVWRDSPTKAHNRHVPDIGAPLLLYAENWDGVRKSADSFCMRFHADVCATPILDSLSLGALFWIHVRGSIRIQPRGLLSNFPLSVCVRGFAYCRSNGPTLSRSPRRSNGRLQRRNDEDVQSLPRSR